jgi:dinuclear metal center YbgI/SA1388 family protein
MTVGELYEGLCAVYPKTLSCPWDNDGIMMTKDPGAQVKRILVSLDATEGAVLYAGANGFDVLLTHHPMLFRGVKNVTPDTVGGRRILAAAAGGVSVISLHTRLDAGRGGVNETLCRALGFEPSGTFGDEEAPALGRFADTKPLTGGMLAQIVREKLGCRFARVTGNESSLIRRIGFCGGDGKDFIPAALAAGCGAYVTGDAGYNMAEDAAEDGLFTVEAGHWHTEAPVCAVLAELATGLTGAYSELYDSCAYRIL